MCVSPIYQGCVFHTFVVKQCNSFSFSVTTVGAKCLSVTKSPAMMLMQPTRDPGVCSLTQPSSMEYVDITKSFRDSDGCVQMYFRSTVRLIPATKKPPGIQKKQFFCRLKRQSAHRFARDGWIPGLSCFFLCSKASISVSALHLLAHQYGMCGHRSP